MILSSLALSANGSASTMWHQVEPATIALLRFNLSSALDIPFCISSFSEISAIRANLNS